MITILVLFALLGCEQKCQKNEAVFIDSKVTGLRYDAGNGLVGTTDKDGVFLYQQSQAVKFYVGNLYLGKGIPVSKPKNVQAKRDMIVTPFVLAKNSEINNSRVLKISRLLQSLDEDANPSNGITISEETKKAFSETRVLEQIRLDTLATEEGITLRDLNKTRNHLEETFGISSPENSSNSNEDNTSDTQNDSNSSTTTDTNTSDSNTSSTELNATNDTDRNSTDTQNDTNTSTSIDTNTTDSNTSNIESNTTNSTDTNSTDTNSSSNNTDTQPPTITLKGEQNITLYSDEHFVEPGFEAMDNVDGNITNDVNASGSVDMNTPGSYAITYIAVDKAGNEETKTRSVTVRPVPVAQTQSVVVVENHHIDIKLNAITYDANKKSFTIISTPQHGVLSGIAPNVTYTPLEDFVGSDSFGFKVSDDTRESNITQINIEIAPSNITKALSAGDASFVTEQEIHDALDKNNAKLKKTCQDRVDFIFKNSNYTSFDTIWASSYTYSMGSENTPIFVSKNGTKEYNYGWIGEKDNGVRYAFIGMSIFSPGRYNGGKDNTTYKALDSEIIQLFNWLFKQDSNRTIFSKQLTVLTSSSQEESDIKTWMAEHNITSNWNFTQDLSLLDGVNFDIFVQLYPNNSDLIQKAMQQGKAVIAYTDWAYISKDSVLSAFGLGSGWYQSATVNNLATKDKICDVLPSEKLKKAINHLKNSDLDFDYSQNGVCTTYVGRITCLDDKLLNSDNDTLGRAFMDGTNFLKNGLSSFDYAGKNIFDTHDRLLKLAVLLGDKYRQNIHYPMDKIKTDDTTFYKALFADYSVSYARGNNRLQTDLGDYTAAPQTLHDVNTEDVNITLTPSKYDEWTSALVYALPGQKVTIKRVDNSHNEVKIRLTMIRKGSSRVWNPDSYTRPQFMRSHELKIEQGKEYNLSSPYGGTIMVYSKGVSANAVPFTLEFKQIAKHPTLSKFDDQSIQDFLDDLESSNFDWADIKTPYVEIHSLKSKLKSAFDTAGYFPYHNDVKLYIRDLKHYLIESNLNLAGFKGDELALNQNVQTFCSDFNLDCASDIHIKPKVQHINSDVRAHCGSGCSGNPFDVTWGVTGTSWGDNHEFGHNMQPNRLKIYGARSGEVSNNIFPLHANWLYLKDHNMSLHPNIEHTPSNIEAFDMLYKAIKDGKNATLNEHPLWKDSGTYDKVFERLSFYAQIVYELKSWDIYTKLYLTERLFGDALTNDAKWNSQKGALGFSDYTLADTKTVEGNDFMAIVLSNLTKKDFRDYFDMWGISISQKAKDQIVTNGFPNGVVKREYFIRSKNEWTLDLPHKSVILDGTDIDKRRLSGVCVKQSSLSECNSINIVHTLPTPQNGSVYFVSKYADNGPTNSIGSGTNTYTTLNVHATDDLNQSITLKLRAAKTIDGNGVDGTLVGMNDTTTVNDQNTSLVIWLDPSDNNLDANRTYSMKDTPIIKVVHDNQTIGQIIVQMNDFKVPNIIALTDINNSLIQSYPKEEFATYFVTSIPSQGPSNYKWTGATQTEKFLNIKVKDDSGNLYDMKLESKRDGYSFTGNSGNYTDINSGFIWTGYTGNALIVRFNTNDNPNLPSGHYKSVEPIILNAKLWNTNSDLRELLYINVDIVIP